MLIAVGAAPPGPSPVPANAAAGAASALAVPMTPTAAIFSQAVAGATVKSLTVRAGSRCRPEFIRCCGARRPRFALLMSARSFHADASAHALLPPVLRRWRPGRRTRSPARPAGCHDCSLDRAISGYVCQIVTVAILAVTDRRDEQDRNRRPQAPGTTRGHTKPRHGQVKRPAYGLTPLACTREAGRPESGPASRLATARADRRWATARSRPRGPVSGPPAGPGRWPGQPQRAPQQRAPRRS